MFVSKDIRRYKLFSHWKNFYTLAYVLPINLYNISYEAVDFIHRLVTFSLQHLAVKKSKFNSAGPTSICTMGRSLSDTNQTSLCAV